MVQLSDSNHISLKVPKNTEDLDVVVGTSFQAASNGVLQFFWCCVEKSISSGKLT